MIYIKVKVINMIKEIETQTRADRYCCHESQLTQDIHPMLTQCRSTVCDAMLAYKPTENKVNSCLHVIAYCFNVGPVSQTVAQLQKNIWQN